MNELRCQGTMHGRFIDATHLEVKCNRRVCGVSPGVVVLHIFNLVTGELETTKFYADPSKERKSTNDNAEPGLAVRSARC